MYLIIYLSICLSVCVCHTSIHPFISLYAYYYYRYMYIYILNSSWFIFQVTPTTFRPGIPTTLRPGFPSTVRPGFPTTARPGFSTVRQNLIFLSCWFPLDIHLLTTRLSIYIYESICLSVYLSVNEESSLFSGHLEQHTQTTVSWLFPISTSKIYIYFGPTLSRWLLSIQLICVFFIFCICIFKNSYCWQISYILVFWRPTIFFYTYISLFLRIWAF